MEAKIGQLACIEENPGAFGASLQPDMRLVGNGNGLHCSATRRTVDFSYLVKLLAHGRISQVNTMAVGLGPKKPVPLEKVQSISTNE
jgi:hypothetical protein